MEIRNEFSEYQKDNLWLDPYRDPCFETFLTVQSPEGTVRLSEGLRIWLEQFGIYSDFYSFWPNAHLVMYFVLGIALPLYGQECLWKWRMIILIGCGIGVLDEVIKVVAIY